VNGLVLNGIGIANSTSDGVSSVGAAKSALAVANAINNKSGETKVSADVLDTTVTLFNLGFTGPAYDLGSGEFEINGVSITGDDIDNVNTLIDRINLKSSFTGVKASLSDGSTDDVVLTAQDGRNIQVNFHGDADDFAQVFDDAMNFSPGGLFAGYTVQIFSLGFSGVTAHATPFETVSGAFVTTHGFVRTGAVQLRASEEIEVAGSNVSQSLGFVAGTVEVSNATALDSVDISSQSGAADALAITDSVIRTLTNLRAGLGAIQSRLQTSIANLSITSENLSAAQSQIRDADIAVETAELTRAQILQQAGVAVLGQANVSAQTALSLLRFG
jgi:flagellin